MTSFNFFNIKMVNKKQAFSLIEISIAVVVLGIVAAIAISMYTNYTQRGGLTKVVNSLIIARDQVMLRYAEQEQFPSNATMTGEINALLAGDITIYVTSIVYNPGTVAPIPAMPTPLAYIQANLNTSYWTPLDSQSPPQIFLVATQSGDVVNWNCYVTNLSISNSDIPSSCQII